MKRYSFLSLLLFVLFVSISTVGAQEIICPPPPCPVEGPCPLVACPMPRTPGVFTNPSWLKVDHHRVSVDVADQIATTNVDLEFVNEGDGLAEGTFLFPLPMGA